MAFGHRRERRGNTMVEMAIALPIFLLFVWGIFTMGMIYSHQLALNTAAREAARMGVVGRTDTELMARIKRVTPQMDHSASRFIVAIDRDTTRVAVGLQYTERVVGVPPLTTLFNGKKLRARAEHKYETTWITR